MLDFCVSDTLHLLSVALCPFHLTRSPAFSPLSWPEAGEDQGRGSAAGCPPAPGRASPPYPTQNRFNTHPRPEDPKIFKDTQFTATLTKARHLSPPWLTLVFGVYTPGSTVAPLSVRAKLCQPSLCQSQPFVISAVLHPALIRPQTALGGLRSLSLSKRERRSPELGPTAGSAEESN